MDNDGLLYDKRNIYSTKIFITLQCFENEYGCNKSECVALSKRCDEVPDCADESDEDNCELVDINESKYHKEYPPIQEGDQTTVVNVSIHIVSIYKIDELEMTFRVIFLLELTW